jgi:hypothetical protein
MFEVLLLTISKYKFFKLNTDIISLESGINRRRRRKQE